MQRNGISNCIRTIAAPVAAVMIMILLLSLVFVIRGEDHHDCCGEDCPICSCIRECSTALSRLDAVPASSAAALFLLIAISFMPVLTPDLFVRETPVSGKVRLNN